MKINIRCLLDVEVLTSDEIAWDLGFQSWDMDAYEWEEFRMKLFFRVMRLVLVTE